MSLKSFHLFFIVASTLLSAGFGSWCFNQYSYTKEGWVLGLGIGALVITLGLVAYLPWFIRRYREFSFLSLLAVMGLAWGQTAQACTVCAGNPASPLVQSANTGIWFLLAVIGSVLVAFLGLFGFWYQRARRLDRRPPTRLAA